MKLLHDLPDDCLILIFARVPLSDRIGLHRVCPRWRSLQSLVTTTTKSLTLHIATTEQVSQAFTERSFLDIPYLDPLDQPYISPLLNSPSLTFPALTPNIVSQLATLLPNIEALQLNFKLIDISNITFIIELLQNWSSKLATFEFNFWQNDSGYIPLGHKDHINCPQNVLTIFPVLNQECLKLQNLLINSEEEIGWGTTNVGFHQELDLPCLERLETFCFNSHDDFTFLYSSLVDYATENEQMKQINIGNTIKHNDMDPSLYPVEYCLDHPKLLHKFTSLPCCPIEVVHLPKFANLTTLYIGLGDLLESTVHLAKLNNLVHLGLFDYFGNIIQQYTETPSTNFHRLTEIKIVCLSLENIETTNLQSSHWSWIFPSVYLVELNYQDSSRGPNDRDWETQMERIKKCLLPLKQYCTLKRFVTACSYSDYSTSNEIVYNIKHCKEWTIDQL